MAAATMMMSSQMQASMVQQRGGVASTTSRVAAHTSPSCMMFRAPRRFNPAAPMPSTRPAFRRQANGKCNSGFGGGTYGPYVWGMGGNSARNMEQLQQLLRMWGLSPDSQRWQDMMRDLERGKAPWGTVNEVMEDVASAIALPVDFEESEDTYSFIADVPGLEKGDIKIRVNQEDRQLSISGERRRPAPKADSAEGNAPSSEPVSRRRRTERRFGRFERKFGKAQLPDDADLDAVSAKVEKGVLTIMVRKLEGTRPNIKDVFID